MITQINIDSQNAFYINSLFKMFTKIYSLELLFNHVMVIRKIDIVNVYLVKGNFATGKHYHINRKRQLATRKINFLKFLTYKMQHATREIISLTLQVIKSSLQLAKSNLQLVILLSALNINLLLVITLLITLQLVKMKLQIFSLFS